MFLAGCLFCQDLIGQTILLERNVSVDTITPNFGRNRKHYFKYFVGFGFAAGSLQNPTKAGIKIKHGSSFELRLGFYYKRRINHNFSFGATSDFLYARNILTAPMFPILSGYEGKKYYYSGGSLSLAPYFRINFDKMRGNHLGTYIDLSSGISLPLYSRYNQDLTKIADKTRQEVMTSNLPYINPITAFSEIRIGIRFLSIYGRYQLIDLFKTGKMEEIHSQSFLLPKFSFGILLFP